MGRPAQGALQDRMRGRLAALGSSALWRDVIAFLACVLTVACVVGGLFTWQWWAQTGLIAGVVVGLIASSVTRAAFIGVGAAAVGLAVGPITSGFFVPPPAVRFELGAVAALIAMAVAAAVAYLVRSTPASARIVAWAGVGLVVANLWASALIIAAQPTFNPMTRTLVPPMNEQIEGRIPADYAGSDYELYIKVYQDVRAGKDYYSSFRAHFIEWSGGRPPNTVLNIRSPLLTYFWTALPGPRWIIYAFLVLASIAIFLVPVFVAGMVRLPLAIPACAALGGYFLYFPRQLTLLTTEAWAVILAMMAFAAAAASLRSERWRLLTIVAVACAGLAFAVRETLVFVPLAGVVSALVVPGEQRRFRSIAWIAGLAASGGVLAAHYLVARSVVDPNSQYQGFVSGSVAKMIEALVYATDHLGLGGWLAFALAALGLGGILLMPDLRLKVLAGLATVLPLLSFIVVGNAAVDTRVGVTLNYWGTVVVPLLYMCIPVAFRLLPTAAPRTSPAESRAKRR